MDITWRSRSPIRIEAGAAKISIAPFQPGNKAKENGGIRRLSVENSTHGGTQ